MFKYNWCPLNVGFIHCLFLWSRVTYCALLFITGFKIFNCGAEEDFRESLRQQGDQTCLTLCDAMDCSLSGSSVHGIFQVRVLEWVAISFSTDLPNPGIEPGSPTLQADILPSELHKHTHTHIYTHTLFSNNCFDTRN